jgi:flagellar biogenesis protein FliO
MDVVVDAVAGAGTGVTRQVLSVLLVFALLGLTLWKLRRGSATTFYRPWRKSAKPERSIERVERIALTPQHALHLVRVEGREIVVATHPHGCTLIDPAARRASA